MSPRSLGAEEISEALESKLAYVPGGRDCEGRPIIVVNVPAELQPTTKPRLESVLQYFLSVFSEETKQRGLALIVDARRGAWRVARSCIRLSCTYLGSRAASVIVVRPDGFWDKTVDNCTKSRKDREPKYVTLARLPACVDFAQLPYELAGNRAYDHAEWIQTRMRVDRYKKEASTVISKMSDLLERLRSLEDVRSRAPEDDLSSHWETRMELTSAASRVLHLGRGLASSMSRESSQDILDTVQSIHRILDTIEVKQVDVGNAWSRMERSLDTAREIRYLEEGVSQVTNWILGPADAMLNSCYEVGFDVASSEEFRRKHEELELKCRETYGRYAELLHKIDSVPDDRLPEDLKSQRDFMDFVCRSFATRLERRRNVLITSQRFFRLVSEYFDKTSEVFDKLVMGNRTHDFCQAGGKLLKLEKSQSMLESLEAKVVKEGEKLSDILSMPVKDALGRDIDVDYAEDIVNVRDILDATNARKNIFNDSVELQKLTLKQITLIHTYEQDAEQAVKWLNDLFDVLLEEHVEVGCNESEIQSQKEDHQAFQETAKGTFDYGYQLVNGARVLRMSCRLPLDGNGNLSSRLRQAWRQLRSVGEEQLTRLRVCAVFHRSVDEHCSRLHELIEAVESLRRGGQDEDNASELRARTVIRDILGNREELLLDVGRMVRLGRLLRTRLKEPLRQQRMSKAEDASTNGSNLTAVEAISTKLAEVTRLAEKLDAKLCEAGARTRPAPVSPISPAATPSSLATLSTSTPATVTSATSQTTLAAIPTSSAKSVSPATSRDATSPLTLPVSPALSTGTVIETSSRTEAVPFPTPGRPKTIGLTAPEKSTSLSASPAPEKSTSTPALSSTESYRLSSPIPASATTVVEKHESYSVSSVAASSVPCLPTSNGEAHSIASGGVPSSFRFRSSHLEDSTKHKEHEVVKVEGERPNEESAAEDSTYEGYVTAPECSTTAPSRSDSFVTSPDCDEFPLSTATVLPFTISSSPTTWWRPDSPEPVATTNVSARIDKAPDKPVFLKEATTRVARQGPGESDGAGPVDRLVSLEKSVEERTGKVVKEVTETTTLRVSHDIRLDVASYKVTSNIHQDHREDIDVKEIHDIERTITEDSHARTQETTNRIPSKEFGGSKPASKDASEDIFHRTSEEKRSYAFAKECKDTSTTCVRLSRQHEDSGIEMSPTKREPVDDEFLEKLRKVSPRIERVENDDRMTPLTNGGAGRWCGHEAARYEQLESRHFEISAGARTNDADR